MGPSLAIHQPEEVLGGMNAWCVEHHGKSGLTERCRESEVSLAEAEARVLEFVSAHTPAGRVPLCGNTIHCDLAFLKRHMPRCACPRAPPAPTLPPSPSPRRPPARPSSVRCVLMWPPPAHARPGGRCRLVKHFHYQVVDVSSIKVLCRRWFPQRARKLPKKRLAHTAMSDVLESIEELRYYKDHFFGAPAQPGGGGARTARGTWEEERDPPSGPQGNKMRRRRRRRPRSRRCRRRALLRAPSSTSSWLTTCFKWAAA